ncbi:transmembrane protein 231 [Trichonephila clavata]|uniref:Transmembrane protein 231 n=1 Tax=Trichonephila clavata TaxID=2740835 RepID=A0A8X6IVG0_TRICU|nr:transmembrane protein 231 [Trichonephila clavata]
MITEKEKIPVLNISKIDRPFISLENILLEYMKRNITTSLKNVYSVWQAGHAANDSFKINLVILYSEDSILYTVGFWQLLKWALVQYMAVFILISHILKKIKIYLFRKQILSSIVINPIKQKL